MKRFLFTTLLALLLTGFSSRAFAQGNLHLQPAWGPVGYEIAYFYYLPDLNIYYDVTNALFYFFSGNVWVSAKYLPAKYRVYDLYSLYKVVINDERTPWLNNSIHKKKFKMFQKDRTQTPIRYGADDKYKQSKQNTNSWVDPQRSGNKTPKKQTNNPPKNNNNKSSTSKSSSTSKDNNKSNASKSSSSTSKDTNKSSTSKSSSSSSTSKSKSSTSKSSSSSSKSSSSKSSSSSKKSGSSSSSSRRK